MKQKRYVPAFYDVSSDSRAPENLNAPTVEDDGSVFVVDKSTSRYIRPGELVYPCSTIESYYGKISKYNTVQTLWLELDDPITPEDMKLAFHFVSRQVPHLQFCLAKLGNKLWFKRMKTLEIDFEMSSKGALEMHHEMLETKVDLWNGPLWKARLNLNLTSDKISCNNKKTGCLSLCVHHAITDATANMKICRDLLTILNKIKTGQKMNPECVPLSPTTDLLSAGKMNRIYVAKHICRKTFSTLTNMAFGPSCCGALYLPAPTTNKPKARILFNQFTNCETEIIRKLCKDNKITVNSFLVAAVNIALLKTAETSSKKVNSKRKISFYQSVSMRKHLEPQYQNSSGCHISNIEMQVMMACSDCNDFWKIAQKTHADIKKKIDVYEEPFKNKDLHLFDYGIVPINKLLNALGFRIITPVHHGVTNMGNLESMLPPPNETDNLKITYLLRSVVIKNIGVNMVLTFQTFRGRLMISVDYTTNTLSEGIAQEFINTFMKSIHILISPKEQ